MLFPGSGIGDRAFPSDLSQFLNAFYRQKGVQVWNGDSATGLERRSGQLVLQTQSQRELVVDGVVAGIGIQPNVELARIAALQTGQKPLAMSDIVHWPSGTGMRERESMPP